ncbi:MAG: CYTH domain-containing protein [Prevotellaceae bacterium]|jgi:CYTH domain-containing protein|nr:CYTH domain-containing protein [Prevotellaceae bacterium]
MAQEIERKFLITGDYKSKAYAHSRITQGYICRASGRTVRVRIRDDKGYLTIKGASDASGIARYEWEKEIALSEAHELMQLCEPGIIDKTRYLVRSGQHLFEIDEFYGENEGLEIAEVELKAEDEPFEKPDFVGREVTGERQYYNAQLTLHPYREWSEQLQRR